jgi:hypothetical protein
MITRDPLIGRGWHAGMVALTVGLLVAGCASTALRTPPAATLQLIGSGPLEIPNGCDARPGAMYRTGFVVQPDGRVADATSESGDGCVQAALRQWVSTFAYQPISEPTPTVFDWMMVTGSRRR